MINMKDHNQGELFDTWPQLGPKRRKLLDSSWPGLFRKHLLPVLPVRKLADHFSAGIGRPSKELSSSLGIVLFQQIFDLSDVETVEQAAFNLQWHYALDLTGESDGVKYISAKTLWTLRDILVKAELDRDVFAGIRDKIIEVFGVSTEKQRLDSVHIHSNMRRLGRIRLISAVLLKFFRNLKRQYPLQYHLIPSEMQEKYSGETEDQLFPMVKPSDSPKVLADICQDLFVVHGLFKGDPVICGMHSYKQLDRVLREQCDLETPGSALPKAPKDVSASSLQNPSDEDAGYDGHKGQGYQVQVQETFCPDKTKEHLNVLTHVSVQSADESDAEALLAAIDRTRFDGVKPKELLVDSLYGGADNIEKAGVRGVEVISPMMGRPVSEDRVELADFTMDESGEIVSCPNKCTPVKQKNKKSRYSVSFEKQSCEQCPLRDRCPAKAGSHHHHLNFSMKDLKASRRRRHEQSGAFREKYRWRAGVEATMSEYDRRTGVKQLRVRGLDRVRFAAVMKAVGINLLRAARHYAASGKKNGENLGPGADFGFLMKATFSRWTALCGHAEEFFRMFHSAPIIARQNR